MNKIMLALLPAIMSRLIVTAILTAVLLIATSSIAAESAGNPAELTFLTWGEYINKDVVAAFEAEYKAKVNFIYFESDDTRNEMVMNTEANGYDILLLNAANISSYKTLGWITPFNVNNAPNINYARLPQLANLDKQDKICTPYSWGTTGIAYRKDLLTAPISSWKQIFSPAPELKGKILMTGMGGEVVGMALKSLGYSMASSNSQELEEAHQLLLAQSPAVAGYAAVATAAKKSKLVKGEVSVTLTYSGDALFLKALNPQIEYVVPEEGGAVWADFICLSEKANNPELAHRFINFINRPEQAAKNALFIQSATPNSEAEKLLPAEFLNNPIIYPGKALIAQSETERLLPSYAVKKHNMIMSELRKTLQ